MLGYSRRTKCIDHRRRPFQCQSSAIDTVLQIVTVSGHGNFQRGIRSEALGCGGDTKPRGVVEIREARREVNSVAAPADVIARV